MSLNDMSVAEYRKILGKDTTQTEPKTIPYKTTEQSSLTVDEFKELVRIGIDKMREHTKYNNVKTVVDGITFDSKAEARRYSELVLLKKAGEIQGFGRQPSFIIFDGGTRYIPDFIVCGADGTIWVEDVKSQGTITNAFKLKYKAWEEKYQWLELRVIDKDGNVIYGGKKI